MASPVDIASIFRRPNQTPKPETQAQGQGASLIRSLFMREATPEATPEPQQSNPILSYFNPVAYSQQQAAYNKSQGIEDTPPAPEAKVKEMTAEEKRNLEQRNKNKALASGRPATLFSQPESSNIKVKKPTLGSGS